MADRVRRLLRERDRQLAVEQVVDAGREVHLGLAKGKAAVADAGFLAIVLYPQQGQRPVGLRVSEEEEIAGLDISEHGMYGYPEQFIPEAELVGYTPAPIKTGA